MPPPSDFSELASSVFIAVEDAYAAALGRKRAGNGFADSGGSASDDATRSFRLRSMMIASGQGHAYLLSTAMSRFVSSVIAMTEAALTMLTNSTYRQISQGLPPPAGNNAVAMIGVSPLA